MNQLELDILKARESRQEILGGSDGIKVITSLNVPGKPKINENINNIARDVTEDVLLFLEGVLAVEGFLYQVEDAAGYYALISFREDIGFDARFVKELCEILEKFHPIGRLIDLDVYDELGDRVSSGRVKSCFVCGENAKLCIRGQKHTVEEARMAFDELLLEYLEKAEEEGLADYLALSALTAMIAEVALDPKPGLVTRKVVGIHKDMNFDLFVKSALAIVPGFRIIALKATEIENLYQFREIGLQMELWMFNATKGINTHKGMIFVLGLVVWAVALSFEEYSDLDRDFVSESIKQITKGVTNELKYSLDTHGGQVFNKYRLTGVRGEVEAGLPSVFEHGFEQLFRHLPIVLEDEEEVAPYSEAYKAALVAIIANSEDTNVVYRSGLESLGLLQNKAKEILEIDVWDYEAEKKYGELCLFCEENNVSCGGAADLLAVAIFLSLF
jgi:holo-ACP synthase / triphosphoribosyl-dephospho-CoA synthase